ncbi:transglycosylase domain-containing protein [Sanguibacter suaedae]|uniref:Penicillin-binding protein n=1 Tax=Sanguibacter suaedae TaxID=2795737 RepID=A0A934MDI0_9MICO|nr:transglycosylase domain-containing protein [Sanguibacter suaedae]MBI9114824.1 penicillin-binding protein [Sanguibacter suaedae]
MPTSSNRPIRPTGRTAGRAVPARTPAQGSSARGTTASARTTTASRSGSGRSARSARAGSKKGFFNYPRAGKGRVHRWIPSWRFVLGSMLTGIALVCGLVFAAYATTTIPSALDTPQSQASTVFYADGATPMAKFALENRVILKSEQIPDHVKHAVVAAEDRSFYENAGIDPQGMARAFLGNLRGGRTTGGSTITQQYAERYYMDTTKDYVGKFKEALLAVKLGQSQDKDEILTNYLNTIYFGRGAHGIEVAAQLYFGKPAVELTVAEAAVIAGVIPSPTNWDPRNDREKSEQRWNYVLDGMVSGGWLSQAERDAQVYPEALAYEQKNTLGGPTGYLLDMVQDELAAKAGIDEDQLMTRGLSIVTTIDKPIQDAAEATAAEMPADAPANLKTAIVTIESSTGAYLALYGGKDFTADQLNAATMETAQAGSTFKPFTLLAAIESGKTLYDTYDGNSPRTFNGYTVGNFGGSSFGQMTLEAATANSVNTVYVELNQEIGPEKTNEVAVRAGVPSDTDGIGENVLSNVLGTAFVNPVDMASAYATFAAQGTYIEPHILKFITELDGSPVYEASTSGTSVFDPADIAELTYALEGVVKNGSGDKALSLGVPVAGKTGTSQENKSAWFVGYTPQFSTAVSLYQTGEGGAKESIAPFGGYKQITGSSVPLDLWTSYMGKMLTNRPVVDFPERTKPRPTPTATFEPTEEPTEEPETEEPVEVEQVAVPGGLSGRQEGNVTAALSAAGLNPSISRVNDPNVPSGRVISVSPGEGTMVPPGSTVIVTVSQGPAQPPPPVEEPEPEPEPEPEQPPQPEPSQAPTTTPPTQGQNNNNNQNNNSNSGG